MKEREGKERRKKRNKDRDRAKMREGLIKIYRKKDIFKGNGRKKRPM